MYLAYTIFADAGLTTVRQVYQTADGTDLLRAFASIKGSEPKHGDIIAGCRIDRIGSENAPVDLL